MIPAARLPRPGRSGRIGNPDLISDQRTLLTEGATITALVEGDLTAARKARAGADAILQGLQAAA